MKMTDEMEVSIAQIYSALKNSKTMLSILDFKKLGIKNPRKALKYMEGQRIITKHKEYLHNSMKTETKIKIDNIDIILSDPFRKKSSKLITEKIKGTLVYKYKLVKAEEINK